MLKEIKFKDVVRDYEKVKNDSDNPFNIDLSNVDTLANSTKKLNIIAKVLIFSLALNIVLSLGYFFLFPLKKIEYITVGSKINLNYEMKSYNSGDAIRPWAVYDNGVRTFFNYDGILPTDDLPAISRVLNGVDVPYVVKDAYTLGPSYKGWLYVETISQEGFTVSLGGGENAKILCIKPTVDLRDFYNSQEKKGLQKVNFRKEPVKEEITISPQKEEKQ
ncbi:MAG: hypothetical protein GY793_04235 [Proteobacteria bacterium]|nr:hypothetical protein [Pseudomonadota bacterium]